MSIKAYLTSNLLTQILFYDLNGAIYKCNRHSVNLMQWESNVIYIYMSSLRKNEHTLGESIL